MRPLTVPAIVARLGALVHQAGGQTLLVGGSVRDHVLGRPVKDWDLEVHRVSADTLEALLRQLGHVSTIGRAFSVFKLHHPDVDLDVSLPRRDSKVGPGHRGIQADGDPFLGIEEASRRRDLTINALMVDVHTGTLLDPWNGLVDLEARRLRAVDETTFLEDPLRALRAVQFAARLDFSADPSLIPLCRAARLDELAHERILGEWAKLMVRGTVPSRGLALARDAELLDRVFPDRDHPEATDALLDRAVAHRDALSPEGRGFALMLLVWLHDVSEDAAVATLDRLHLHRHEGFRTREVALDALRARTRPHATDADLRHLAAVAEAELVVRAHGVVHGTEVRATVDRLHALGIATEAPRPLLLGRHLKALGRPGPWMGTLLDAVYTAQLDGQVTTLDDAKALARTLHAASDA